MRRFYAYIASECTLYSVTPVTLFSTMKRVTGVTQKQPENPTKSMNSHQTKHRKTSKSSLLYLFYSKKWKHWYLAFADLSILFLILSLNGRLKRDTYSLVRMLNSHDALITWAWNACDESLSRIDSSVHLGADHQKSYGGGWGIFEPQEFIFVIKFLVWIVFRSWHEYLLGLIFVHEFFSL